ncbi:hypothetical protein BD779DRAFT_1522507 [Infundibulicybe gibba]|nr:hypothetical protein BD779DRAFT_1522507 [Infundibulicybe gibba]
MNVPNTIVATIHLADKFVRYTKATRDARVDHLDLLSEVSAIKTFLEIARADFDYTSNTGGDEEILNQLVKVGIEKPLNACYDALEYAVDKLENLMPGGPDTKKPVKKRLRWPFCEWEMNGLLNDTGRLRILLLLRLRLDFIDAARDELANVGDVAALKAGVFSLEAGRRGV